MAKKNPHKPKRDHQHVRIYAWEMESEAWRTLSCYGRALIIEMRALYTGRENRVYMSLRQIMERLGIGRKAAEMARNEVLERGWIRLIEQASFDRKVRHAPVYALTNEPLDDRDGGVAPKDYMTWSTPPQKNTVYLGSTDGVPREHRGPKNPPQNHPHGVPREHRGHQKSTSLGVPREHTDKLPGGGYA
jgi:hypothetical protein